MATAVLNTKAYKNTDRKASFMDKYLDAYRENRASIICGLLSMNGATNLYPLYKALSE